MKPSEFIQEYYRNRKIKNSKLGIPSDVDINTTLKKELDKNFISKAQHEKELKKLHKTYDKKLGKLNGNNQQERTIINLLEGLKQKLKEMIA